MKKNIVFLSIVKGAIGTSVLLIFYFSITILVSGWKFTFGQFSNFWYYIILLSSGFGIQIGLFSYLRSLHRTLVSGKIVAASGTTSGIAMISCCAHYLSTLIPVLGASGFVTLVSQYQTKLFWLGIVSNFVGIIYMIKKIKKVNPMKDKGKKGLCA